MSRSAFAAVAAMAVALTMVLAPAKAQPPTESSGTLDCDVSAGIGLDRRLAAAGKLPVHAGPSGAARAYAAPSPSSGSISASRPAASSSGRYCRRPAVCRRARRLIYRGVSGSDGRRRARRQRAGRRPNRSVALQPLSCRDRWALSAAGVGQLRYPCRAVIVRCGAASREVRSSRARHTHNYEASAVSGSSFEAVCRLISEL